MIWPQMLLDIHEELIVDNFAGGGGASCGIEMALGRLVDIAVNHDREAVAVHAMNHPRTQHLCEDVFAVDPVLVTAGRPVGLAWFSPDCKHFSKAKGGKPRAKKIRGLAWVMVKWAATVRPRVLVLENVEEFSDWGPLLATGQPCPQRRGRTFASFVSRLRNLGYAVEWRELRACDFGAPTIRKRLFLIARCDGRPIVWPEPTHGAPASVGVRARKLKPWRTAAECIDWTIPCPSIFLTREEARTLGVKRPLAEATLRRIARGIRRYVIEAANPFIVQYHSAKRQGDDRCRGVDEPLPTQTVENRFGLAVPFVAPVTHAGDARVHDLQEPLRTVTGAHRGELGLVAPILTEHANASSPRCFDPAEPLRTQCSEVKGGHFALVAPTLVNTANSKTTGRGPNVWPMEEPLRTATAAPGFAIAAATLVQTGYGEREGQAPRALDVQKPLGTVVGEQKHALVAASLMVNTTGHSGAAADAPVPTIPTGGHHALVTSFLAKHYGDKGQRPGSTMDEPVGTVTAVDHHSLVAANMVQMHHGDKQWSGANEPLKTVLSGANHHGLVRSLLIKYYGNEKDGAPVGEPMHTVTATDRFGLVTVAGQDYHIADIGLRMLAPRELFRAQGFPDSYIIDRAWFGDGVTRVLKALTKGAQVRLCGNSVCPPLAAAIVAANVPEMAVSRGRERRVA